MQLKKKLMVVLGIGWRIALIPIAVLRLMSLSRSVGTSNFLFAHTTTEMYTQLEMCFGIVAATLPCFTMFLHAFNSGVLGKSIGTTVQDSQLVTIGSGGGKSGGSKTMRSSHKRSEPIELMELANIATVGRGSNASDRCSTRSDDSQRAIVVKREFGVQYDTRY
ncbi:hypothetical protein LTR95_006041 [Oleoguttula sp. CCFEE 5521]